MTGKFIRTAFQAVLMNGKPKNYLNGYTNRSLGQISFN